MENNTTAGFRLSIQQERVWRQQAGSTLDAYCEVLLEGPLDGARLRSALERTIQHHEILRTVFHCQAGVTLPFQVILGKPAAIWSECDETAKQRSQSSHLDRREGDLDLQTGPCVKANLVRLGIDRHLLVLRAPALLADSKSLSLLVNELGSIYASKDATNGAAGALQYVDFVEWQNELLHGDDTAAGRDYWRNHFRSFDLATEIALPLEIKTVASRQFSPNIYSVILDPQLQGRINALAEQENVGVEQVFAATWSVLLSRLCVRPEIIVGYEFDGRKYEELQNALGPFAQTVPLQFVVGEGDTFLTRLRQTQSSVADARNWEESFSWALLEGMKENELGPRLPLQFSFVESAEPRKFADVLFGIQRQEVCSDRFKLKLTVEKKGAQVSLHFHFDGSRLSSVDVERWAENYQILLGNALTEPSLAVSRLPILSQKERELLIVDWNKTSAPCPSQCFHELFEVQVALTPERPALRVADQQLSYQTLNQQANRLAHFLRKQGIGPDSRVGLAVDRSLEMIVALLGIMKAGGAYVPLNADNPKPRLARQLDGVTVLLTEEKFVAHMPEVAGRTLCLDRDKHLWAAQPDTNPQVNTAPENLAYVIYTSGSTGVPKGVGVRHRNLVNYASFIVRRLELERYPQGLNFATVSTIGADLGNTCVFPSLISGGCLHVIRFEDSTDNQRFANYNAQYPVDVLKIVPSHLLALLNSGDGKSILPKRFLILGGETLTTSLLQKIESLGAGCEVFNHYGPTETTVGSLTLRIKDYDFKNSSSSSIPIGRPIANTQLYLLDTHLQPVALGAVGELFIAGAGVTAGYIAQPEKTAERFLSDPFSIDTSARMYRTGDLARYWADGHLEFLGRSDDQVKIRGFRIELGEIESALMGLPGVKQATVVGVENQETLEKRLAGYVVLEKNAARDTQVLLQGLRDQLPEYMIPTTLMILDKIPLNPNGKVDRKALPRADESAARQKTYAAPSSPTEQIIANIWSEVLRLESVGREDDFFQLGGHSLLATQVVSRLRRTLDIELPLRALFEYTNVASLSQYIEQGKRAAEAVAPPAIHPIPRDQSLPLSFAQQRLWIVDQLEPNSPLYNISRPLRLGGPVKLDALQNSLNKIVARHEALRTTFRMSGGHAEQVIGPVVPVAVETEDLEAIGETEREAVLLRRATEESLRPFDLAKGPLLRVKLFRLRKEDHLLLLTMHHIVSDAWSAAVFYQEFTALYNSFVSGGTANLPELTIQYADYAYWQRQWLEGSTLDNQLRFWREQFRGVSPLLTLPTDRARPEIRTSRGGHETVAWPKELTDGLKAVSRKEGVTLFMSLLAAFQILLSRYSGQTEMMVGTDVANRPTLETERLIGFFINLLALRGSVAGNPTFRALLARVRETTLKSYAHQDFPFDKLVEELRPERNLSYNPLVQVLFVMQNTPRTIKEFAGLTVGRFDLPVKHSKFDVAVFAAETSNELLFHWIYSAELFDRTTVLRMAQHFENLVRAAVTDPEARVNALEMLTDDQKDQQSQEKQQRKQSQLKKLMIAEPKQISLSESKLGSE